MINFIFRTDVHAADKSPMSWKGDYPAEIWESLRQIGVLASQYSCAAVLDGGDFFHVKAPTKNSHALVAKTALLHAKDYHCPVYCIEGNHDIQANNLDTVQNQPLGVLYQTGVFQHLREEIFEEGGIKVRVVGLPFSDTRCLDDFRSIKKRDGEYLVVIAHALASEDPPDHVEDFFGEPVFRYSDLVFDGCADVYCFGHWHRDQGITQIGSTSFVNQGSISRGSLVRENLTRVPKVALISCTVTGVVTTPILLKVLPAEEVFDIERKERLDKEAKTIETFVDRLEGVFSEEIEEQDPAAILSSLKFEPRIVKMSLEYLQKARESR